MSDERCNCIPVGRPSVIGACACPLHGMNAMRRALDKPLRETILAVLTTMPKDAAPEHLASMIEGQVRAWQAVP